MKTEFAPQLEIDRPDYSPEAHRSAASALHLKTILLPVDFSENSLAPLIYALPLAKTFGAEIVLLHVVPPAGASMTGDYPLRDEVEAGHAAQVALEEVAHTRVGDEVPVRVLVRTGFIFDTVIAVAREIHADLLIVSTHGHNGMKRMFTGSMAECMVGSAPCAVLVAREPEHAAA